jgi:hypothetical protein
VHYFRIAITFPDKPTSATSSRFLKTGAVITISVLICGVAIVPIAYAEPKKTREVRSVEGIEIAAEWQDIHVETEFGTITSATLFYLNNEVEGEGLGVDIILEDGNRINGRVELEGDEIDVDNRFRTAVLSPIDADLCYLAAEGGCAEDVQVPIEAHWEGTADLIFTHDIFQHKDEDGSLKVRGMEKHMDAVAIATIDGESLGESDFAYMHEIKVVEVITSNLDSQ